MEKSTSEELLHAGLDMMSRGIAMDKIKARLQEKVPASESLDELMALIRKEYYGKRRKRGFTTVFIGSVLLVMGFVITLALFHSESSISYAMYTITTVGIALLLWGMADIMGW